jgi:hypothetical protein
MRMTLLGIGRHPLQAIGGKARRLAVRIALCHERQSGARLGEVLKLELRETEFDEGIGCLALS